MLVEISKAYLVENRRDGDTEAKIILGESCLIVSIGQDTDGEGVEWSPETARAVAKALVLAADEIEG